MAWRMNESRDVVDIALVGFGRHTLFPFLNFGERDGNRKRGLLFRDRSHRECLARRRVTLPARTVVHDHCDCFVLWRGSKRATPEWWAGMCLGFVASPAAEIQVKPLLGMPSSPAPLKRATNPR